MNKVIIRQYLAADKKLMTLIRGGEKSGAPTEKVWTSDKFRQSDETILEHDGPIGWVLGVEDFVIDIDPRNNGEKSFEKLLCDYPELRELVVGDGGCLAPTVMTPRGGYHIYLSMPEKYRGDRFRKNMNKEYQGIDWLTQGSYCVIAGSEKENEGVVGKYTWSDEDFGEFEQQGDAPECIVQLIRHDGKGKKNGSGSGSDGGGGGDEDLGDFEGMIGSDTSSQWSEDEVLNMLDKLDNNMPNEDWTKVGMALQDWDPIRGLELWENWSRGGDTYKEGETEKRWKSFHLGDGVTLGTIWYMAKDADYDDTALKVSMMVSRIEKASEKQLEFELIPEIKKVGFERLDKEKLVKALQDRYKVVCGVRMPVASLRQSITKSGHGHGGSAGGSVVGGVFIENYGEAPEWCADWMYVNTHGGYMNTKTLLLAKSEAFNLENGKHIPVTEAGGKSSACKYVSDNGFVEIVGRMAYMPSFQGKVKIVDGCKVLNSFNPGSVPVAAECYTADGMVAIEMVRNHLKLLVNTDENRIVLEQWIASNVQFPGRQILWGPVIQSVQGTGKSFLAELLRACLGDANVGTVAPTQLSSQYNAWATGVCVNALEEFSIKGHNRHEAANALKPLVTDRMIQIHPKHVTPYMTQNTTNYFGVTNLKDAIPMGIDDRRWWIIFMEITSLAEMSNAVGEDIGIYFPRLFSSIRSFGGEIRKWFLEYNITAEFMATKQAPMTDDKLVMIAAEEAGFEGLYETAELIEEGGKYYNSECVSSPDLFDQLLFRCPEIEVTNRSKNAILKKLGFMPTPLPIKIDGKTRRVWTKKRMTNKMIHENFQNKVTEDDEL